MTQALNTYTGPGTTAAFKLNKLNFVFELTTQSTSSRYSVPFLTPCILDYLIKSTSRLLAGPQILLDSNFFKLITCGRWQIHSGVYSSQGRPLKSSVRLCKMIQYNTDIGDLSAAVQVA